MVQNKMVAMNKMLGRCRENDSERGSRTYRFRSLGVLKNKNIFSLEGVEIVQLNLVVRADRAERAATQ